LAVLGVLIADLFATDKEKAGPAEVEAATQSVKVIASSGRPKLTVTDGDSQKTYEIPPDAIVELNGVAVEIGEIAAGDVVRLTTDSTTGRVLAVSAERYKAGVVFGAGDGQIVVTTDFTDKKPYKLAPGARIELNGKSAQLEELTRGDLVRLALDRDGLALQVEVKRVGLLQQTWENFRKNLFKPLLLFFYLGFSVPLLKVAFEFPHVIYQGLTIYLLVAIGWHGGEELAELSGSVLQQALMFMVIGFVTNFVIGIVAYLILRGFIPRMRKVDAATVAAYYGSDSAGTFVTCVGVLTAIGISYAAYMPVMLAVMEIPGCLVGLFLVARLRHAGMDPAGTMPDEPGYDPHAAPPVTHVGHESGHHKTEQEKAVEREERMALENKEDSNGNGDTEAVKPPGIFSAELLREVFLNPGLFLLFGGIVVGFVSRYQGHKVTDPDDKLFVMLFQGLLCLFLLEMGMTASRRLKDLKAAGWRYIVFGLLAPNLFATTGICVAHAFSMSRGEPFQLGTYVLFAVLCGAASYIAVPAVQRMAIPEASPTLPLAASLGLTFSYNVTIGIPVYIMIAQAIIMAFPVGSH
jgi:hypothetical protein